MCIRDRLTHVNLNDGVCEGLEAVEANAFSVQHHPEAGPGPHESSYLFARFVQRMAAARGGDCAPADLPGTVPDHDPDGLPPAELGLGRDLDAVGADGSAVR